MNTADIKKCLSLPLAVPSPLRADRLLKVVGCWVLGGVLAGCTVQPIQPEANQDPANPGVNPSKAPVPEAIKPKLPSPLTVSPPVASAEGSPDSVGPRLGVPDNWEQYRVPKPQTDLANALHTDSARSNAVRGEGIRSGKSSNQGLVTSESGSGEGLKSDTGTGSLLGTGMASWYGGQFHGRKTASGERFDSGDLTAAHPSLPFGSKVCVRSPGTGKTVMVRINDRGPFAPGRVIDLSKAAAQELGIQGLGIKSVELWKLKKGSDTCPDDLLLANDDDFDPDTESTPVVLTDGVGTRAAPRAAASRKSTAQRKSVPSKSQVATRNVANKSRPKEKAARKR